MQNSSNQRHAHELAKAVKVLESERRGCERHFFTASAEVIELKSGARFSTRTTDLGPGGCFVDTTVPFPVGAKVRVTLQKSKTTFQTSGNVVYSQPGLGMGIAFDDQDDAQRVALGEWLADITGDHQALPDVVRMPLPAGTHRGPEWVALVRLVRVMITRGILTEAEGTSVLHDPIL
ncbi:MAG: PilZ domain-containing protein [Candidatus Acidiferrales bacterium]